MRVRSEGPDGDLSLWGLLTVYHPHPKGCGYSLKGENPAPNPREKSYFVSELQPPEVPSSSYSSVIQSFALQRAH